jgi:putative ABC transport system substrate-binding protein
VGSGLVASLARPGGNVTGLSQQQPDTAGKRLELLREVVPHLRQLAILLNADNPAAVAERDEVQAAARAAASRRSQPSRECRRCTHNGSSRTPGA